MTIEELLEIPLDNLDKLSEKELTDRVSHYFIVTRPELAKKQPKTFISPSYEHKAKLERAKQLAKLAGIELGF